MPPAPSSACPPRDPTARCTNRSGSVRASAMSASARTRRIGIGHQIEQDIGTVGRSQLADSAYGLRAGAGMHVASAKEIDQRRKRTSVANLSEGAHGLDGNCRLSAGRLHIGQEQVDAAGVFQCAEPPRRETPACRRRRHRGAREGPERLWVADAPERVGDRPPAADRPARAVEQRTRQRIVGLQPRQSEDAEARRFDFRRERIARTRRRRCSPACPPLHTSRPSHQSPERSRCRRSARGLRRHVRARPATDPRARCGGPGPRPSVRSARAQKRPSAAPRVRDPTRAAASAAALPAAAWCVRSRAPHAAACGPDRPSPASPGRSPAASARASLSSALDPGAALEGSRAACGDLRAGGSTPSSDRGAIVLPSAESWGRWHTRR